MRSQWITSLSKLNPSLLLSQLLLPASNASTTRGISNWLCAPGPPLSFFQQLCSGVRVISIHVVMSNDSTTYKCKKNTDLRSVLNDIRDFYEISTDPVILRVQWLGGPGILRYIKSKTADITTALIIPEAPLDVSCATLVNSTRRLLLFMGSASGADIECFPKKSIVSQTALKLKHTPLFFIYSSLDIDCKEVGRAVLAQKGRNGIDIDLINAIIKYNFRKHSDSKKVSSRLQRLPTIVEDFNLKFRRMTV